MPRVTAAEREQRNELIRLRGQLKTARRAVKKYFPNGIVPFDASVFEKLFFTQDAIERQIADTVKSLKSVRESENKKMATAVNNQLKALHQRKKEVEREIKEATNQNSVYYRAAKPYLDAQKLIRQAENYGNIDNIYALYEKACQNP